MASQQLGAVGDATSSLGRGLKKSLENGTKEAGRLASTLGEILDVEDLVKSLRHVTTSGEEQASRKTSVVHEPIDWSKYPPSAFHQRKVSRECYSHFIREEEDEEEETTRDQKPTKDDEEEEAASKPAVRRQSKSKKFSMMHLSSRTTTTTSEKGERHRKSVREQKIFVKEEEEDYNTMVESFQSKFKTSSDRKRKQSHSSDSLQSKFKPSSSESPPKSKERQRRSSQGQFLNNQSQDKLFPERQNKPRSRSNSVVDFSGLSRENETSTSQSMRRKKSDVSNRK